VLSPTSAVAETTPASASPHTSRIVLNVNGRDISLVLDTRVTLLDALREYAD